VFAKLDCGCRGFAWQTDLSDGFARQPTALAPVDEVDCLQGGICTGVSG